MEIGLSLGSNLNDRLAHLSAAKDHITSLDGVTLLEQSPVYETEPVDVPTASKNLLFLNSVIIIESHIHPHLLLRLFSSIEEQMGRKRQARRNAPRPIDIDIIYAGQTATDDNAIILPHPRWAERSFVVKPLAEVRPDLRIPGETRSVQELLLSLPDGQKLVPFVTSW
jgi:2-amino-4-hydroxy-6-hydroxymethyldihydropteridine diphosphokinase